MTCSIDTVTNSTLYYEPCNIQPTNCCGAINRYTTMPRQKRRSERPPATLSFSTAKESFQVVFLVFLTHQPNHIKQDIVISSLRMTRQCARLKNSNRSSHTYSIIWRCSFTGTGYFILPTCHIYTLLPLTCFATLIPCIVVVPQFPGHNKAIWY